MGKVRIAYSHLGIGSAPICGCHDQPGGKLRARNEPPAVVGTTRIGGSASLVYPSGSGRWRLDLGATPQVSRGYVRISQKVPAGTSVGHNLKASNTGAFAGEEVNLGAVVDGDAINAAYRHFELESTLTANTQRDSSPLIDYFDVIYQRGYPSSGSTDLLLDAGFTPERNGSWEIDSIVPSGSTLTLTAQASNRENFDSEVENIGAIAHGNAISKRKRFYKVHAVFQTDATATKTPRLTRIKAVFPNG